MTWISILKTEIFIRRKWQKHVRRIRYTETKTFTGHFLNSKEKEAHWFWLYIWLKRYSAEEFLEILREIVFPNYVTYTYVNDTYTDFIYRFAEAINFIAPSKKIRVKANSKPWFDNQIVSAIQRWDKLY